MGAKDSKPSCISYEDATKRVNENELRRIREAFKRSAGSNGTTLSKNAFLQDVLSEGIPTVLADWLYSACGGTQKGIAFKELLCGLVLLTRGTADEKIKFLWNVYCNDSGTYITKQDFAKALQIEETYQQSTGSVNVVRPTSTELHLKSNKVLVSLFVQSERVNFEQFKQWIENHERATVLSRWLLVESCVNLSTELETPTFYQSLAGVTHLEEQDIGDLEKTFWSLKGLAKTGQLDLESLAPLISPTVPAPALHGVFSAFDENRDGHIDFKELCCGVSAACRGPNVERSKFCFKVFDIDRDGVLNVQEISDMINILLSVAKDSSNSTQMKSLTYVQIFEELRERANANKMPTKVTDAVVNDSADAKDFTFSLEDFMMWSVQSQSNLLQPFMDLLFDVCHVVLGLRPQCRHLEHNIVKGWLAREVRRGYRVGQFWWIVAADWWHNWQQYTQSITSAPCVYCKGNHSYSTSRNSSSGLGRNSLDEAVVCDESFTSNSTESMGDLLFAGDSSSLGSGSSGISCSGRTGVMHPGPIDNSSLIEPSVYKNVRTLTGEGGRLKRNFILSEHREYELIPDSLWKALSQWYRCSLPLPRQVIQVHPSMPVEVELYPLNLRILRHQANPPVAQTVSSWGAVAGGYGAVTSAGSYTSNTVPNVLQPPKRFLANTAAFSRLATVKQVGEFLCQHLKLKPEDVRLWHVFNMEDSACLLEDDNITLQDLAIRDNDQILLEVRSKDLTWPEELGSLTMSQSQNAAHERRATIISVQSVHAAGATGLHNLGNTCFMNSALQVLFNTQPLAQYFLQNMHLYELNMTNKLGTKGQLALRYAELLKEVWTASTRSVAPLKLRFCMTKHAPQFAGGGQHDSQELLEWMLDGLHEDLNRVMEKPYTELKDSNGRADSEVAAEAWTQHHSRNQSIVIDLFYGQLKSKVSCLTCGHESVRFDPFSLLSLPLPVENYTYCEVLVIRLDGSVPIKYGLRLNSESKYADFKIELSKLCQLDAKLMLVCELSNCQIRCSLSDTHKLKVSTATELFVYEIPKGDFWKPRVNTEKMFIIGQGLKDIQRNPALQALPADNQLTHTSVSSTTSDDIQLIASNDKCGANHSVAVNTRTSKVSRCFGNTLCMPQNLLCFKQHNSGHADLSTSPETTFSHATYSCHRKLSMVTNLLPESNSGGSLDGLNGAVEKSCGEGGSDMKTKLAATIAKATSKTQVKCDSQDQRDGKALAPKENTLGFNENNRNFKKLSGIDNSDRRAGGYLIAVHRKLSRQDTYFLSYHKTRPSLFGVPLLIPCYEDGTNKDLYCAVWIQVARLLSPLPSTPPDQANHATDCDDSLGYEFPFTLRAVSDGGRFCALCPWSKFCRGCEIPCNDLPLLEGMIPTSNNPSPQLDKSQAIAQYHVRPNHLFGDGINPGAIQIAIDWDPTALHLRYQSTRERICTEHESVGICRKQQTEPVDLDHCLRAFTTEEKLEETYHCGHCKGKQPATKKLQIWKLPPILIVHLKRFNFVNNKWVKSQKVVNFPFKNFDPTPYLASVPQETILRHKELLEHGNTTNNLTNGISSGINSNIEMDVSISEITPEHSIMSYSIKEVDNIDTESSITDINLDSTCEITTKLDEIQNLSENPAEIVNSNVRQANISTSTKLNNSSSSSSSNNNNNNTTTSNNINNNNSSNVRIEQSPSAKASAHPVSRRVSSNNATMKMRKRLASTSLTKSPVIDGAFVDHHNHHLDEGQDPFDLKYKLYAVVSHSGMLNGGHYISYASNPNNSWYCYNDSSCREISQSQPNIDPSSAYLLFYERQGLNYSPYLPEVDDKSIPINNALEFDDSDNDLRKMCVIS